MSSLRCYSKYLIFYFFIVFSSLFVEYSAVELIVNKCYGENVKGKVKSIVFEPCKQFPCHFERGETANLTVTFVPNIDSDGVYFKYYLRTGRPFFDMIIQVHDSDPNLCKKATINRELQQEKLNCPLKAGQEYSTVIRRIFPISTKYNYFNFVKIQLFNNRNQLIGCADSPVQLHSLDFDSK